MQTASGEAVAFAKACFLFSTAAEEGAAPSAFSTVGTEKGEPEQMTDKKKRWKSHVTQRFLRASRMQTWE